MIIQLIILSILIVYCFYTDVKYTRIPNKATIPGIFLGFIINTILMSDQGLLYGLIFSAKGFALGFGIFLVVHAFGGIGAGDVKLFGAIGALMGWEFTMYATVYSVFLAAIIGIVILIYKKDILKRLVNIPFLIINALFSKSIKPFREYKKYESFQFPFMYAVLPGIILTIYSFYG
jgi:prepilin peptidase CpaA